MECENFTFFGKFFLFCYDIFTVSYSFGFDSDWKEFSILSSGANWIVNESNAHVEISLVTSFTLDPQNNYHKEAP